MPRWLTDRTKRGQSIADFLLPGLGRPTAKKSGRIGQRFVYKQRLNLDGCLREQSASFRTIEMRSPCIGP